jgi:hypothetical protein
VQFKTNFGIALRDKKLFQRSWDGEIEPAVQLLHWSIKLNRTFSTNYAVETSGDNFVEPDFILKRCTNGIRRHIGNLIASPNNTAAFAFRQQIAVRGERAIRETYVEAAQPSSIVFIDDLKNPGIRLSWLGGRETLTATDRNYLHVRASHNLSLAALMDDTNIILEEYPEL